MIKIKKKKKAESSPAINIEEVYYTPLEDGLSR